METACIDNVVESIHLAIKERKKKGENTLVRLIPEDGMDYSYKMHSLEERLFKEKIPCYIDLDNSGSEKDYIVDCRKIKIVYY